MNEEIALKIIDQCCTDKKGFAIYNYCYFKGKDPNLIALFIMALKICPEYKEYITDYILLQLSEEFNIITIRDKSGTYLKSYINNQNNQTNGKEIHKIRACEAQENCSEC